MKFIVFDHKGTKPALAQAMAYNWHRTSHFLHGRHGATIGHNELIQYIIWLKLLRGQSTMSTSNTHPADEHTTQSFDIIVTLLLRHVPDGASQKISNKFN